MSAVHETSLFEKIILRALSFLLMVVITVATLWLAFLFALRLWDGVGEIHKVPELQEAVQNAIGGVFIVLLGLELLETLKTYRTHHRLRLEVVLVVGAIAVARHIIQIDFHRTDGAFLAGLGVLIAALICGYYMLQRIPVSRGGNMPDEPVKAPAGEVTKS